MLDGSLLAFLLYTPVLYCMVSEIRVAILREKVNGNTSRFFGSLPAVTLILIPKANQHYGPKYISDQYLVKFLSLVCEI